MEKCEESGIAGKCFFAFLNKIFKTIHRFWKEVVLFHTESFVSKQHGESFKGFDDVSFASSDSSSYSRFGNWQREMDFDFLSKIQRTFAPSALSAEMKIFVLLNVWKRTTGEELIWDADKREAQFRVYGITGRSVWGLLRVSALHQENDCTFTRVKELRLWTHDCKLYRFFSFFRVYGSSDFM